MHTSALGKAESGADESFTYGRRNRPSTPIKSVLGGVYCDVGEHFQQQRLDYYKKASQPLKLPADKPTKASAMANSFVNTRVSQNRTKDEKKLFKLSKFEKVAPRTDTHVGGRSKTPGANVRRK